MTQELCLVRNLSGLDRSIRAAVGLAFIAYPAAASWPAAWVAALATVGGAQLIAAITGY